VATFLCPVCAHPLLGEDGASGGPCVHVLLSVDRAGTLWCRDDALRTRVAAARQEGHAAGRDPMELLRDALGPEVIFFELLDHRAGAPGVEAQTLVIDLSAPPPPSGGADPH
jgi:hypothetical protein